MMRSGQWSTGSGANSTQGRGWLGFSVLSVRWAQVARRRTPQFRHAQLAITELAGLELALLDLLRQLDSANGDRRVVESLEPEHRPSPLFDSPVVLFNQVVQILA